MIKIQNFLKLTMTFSLIVVFSGSAIGSTDGIVVHDVTFTSSVKPECEARHRLTVSPEREMTWSNQTTCAGEDKGLKTFVFSERQLNTWVYIVHKANSWAYRVEERGQYGSELLFTSDDRIVVSVVRLSSGDFVLEMVDSLQAPGDENRLVIPLRANGTDLQTIRTGLIPAIRAALRK